MKFCENLFSETMFHAERQMGRHDKTNSYFLKLLCEWVYKVQGFACWTRHMSHATTSHMTNKS
jgi:hypothetical protein